MDEPHELEGGGQLTFVRAGHILGAAIVQLDLPGPGGRRRVTFSGDLGVDSASRRISKRVRCGREIRLSVLSMH